MVKNNKGFTLIEVLAVVVILGVISMVAVPQIFNLVNNSKTELYVQDVRRLISQAEYKMRSSSVDLEKPTTGNCIILSLHYLDMSDFSNPPRGGEYSTENSYVVVLGKGNNNYDYAATLIEHAGDRGYYGVKLSKKENISKDSAKGLVSGFAGSTLQNLKYKNVNTASIRNETNGFNCTNITKRYD